MKTFSKVVIEIMLNNVKECTNCGAICNINDTYCKKCSHNFISNDDSIAINNEPILDGFENADVKRFVGKNADYYAKKFAKSKDKNIFLQLNFPALFFNIRWYLYRKMYNTAIILILISYLLSALSYFTISYAFQDDVEHYYTCKQEYIDYNKLDVDRYITNDKGYRVDNPEYDRSKQQNLKEAQNTIRWLDFFVILPSILLSIIIGLLGNYFYKKHTIKNLKVSNYSNGGTSIAFAIIAPIALSVIDVLFTVLLTQIPTVSRFYHAVDGLYPWL